MRDLARRAKISVSKAYAISNGDDNVEFETFENIAAAFSMSPAELAAAIGKGSLADDPKRAPLIAMIRQVPDEDLSVFDRVVRTFVRPEGDKAHQSSSAKPPRRPGKSTSRPDQTSGDNTLQSHYERARSSLALVAAAL